MRAAALMLAMLTSVALAQPNPGPVSRGDLLKRRQYQTDSALSLFVDTTGNDGNACTSTGTDACLTIQGALAKVPARINGVAVTITVGAGSFAGFQVSGFTIAPSTTGAAGYLLIQGTLQNFAPATGTATGTLSAFTASSGATFAIFMDATQSWTVNDLKGQLLTITGGSGASVITRYVIVSNTATTITVANAGSGFNATSTYAIQTWGTTLTSTVPAEVSSVLSFTGFWFTADFIRLAANTADGVLGYGMVIQNFGLTTSVGGGNGSIAVDQEARSVIRWNKIQTATGIGAIVTRNAGGVLFYNNWFKAVPSGIIAGGSGAAVGGLQFSGNFFDAGSTAIFVNGAFSAVANMFSAQTAASIRVNGFMPYSQLVVNRIDGSAIGIQSDSSTGNGGPATGLGMNLNDISNCTSFGVDMSAPSASVFASGLSGTGNATAIRVRYGAHMQISSNSTITGTNEVNVDGTNYTLAAMRALTPKIITDMAYGSAFYE